jgi:hypothetical protein
MTTKTANTKTMMIMKRTMTSPPQHRNTSGITQMLLFGSVLATLAGTHILARQDQAVSQATRQAEHTLVVPGTAGLEGMTLNLPPVPTVAAAPQLPPGRPVAATRSSR